MPSIDSNPNLEVLLFVRIVFDLGVFSPVVYGEAKECVPCYDF